ncbi:MAG: ADP-dependent NAD(P)H-hydrate dehydratase / NAD(P)H-hydrate epimerase [Methanolobus sp.]|nr:ADP-dependent NAD(P)H-hydrate dehydratase / NAD(P)H-hydrate epimerase [Methanolobus sp.]
MEAITPSRMRAVDINCAYLGMRPLQLMENAGAGIAREISSQTRNATVLFVAGRGNNGGDAFVAARHLSLVPGFRARVLLLGSASQIRTAEARINFDLLRYSGVDEVKEIRDSADLRSYPGWKDADIIVDGVLGSGIRGLLREPESTAIDLINAADAFVVSIDSPSGLDAGTGNVEKSVRADLTLTFHKMKTGLILSASKALTGEVRVLGIGVCRDAEEFVGPGDLGNLAVRSTSAHKGNSGSILVIGGGPYSGAPAFAALAALRTGADLVTLAVPEGISRTIAGFSPDLIVAGGMHGDSLCPEHVPLIRPLIDSSDVVIIGPGLGRDEATLEAIGQILPLCRKAVIDADALYQLPLPLPDGGEYILTPHGGEFFRLRGSRPEVTPSLQEKKELVRSFSRDSHAVTVLKGSIDVISDGEETRLNRTGNAGMTVGGTGDVLAGIIGALFATNSAFDAACCGCFINGAAGDLAFGEKGYGLLASDVIQNIPYVMKQEW